MRQGQNKKTNIFAWKVIGVCFKIWKIIHKAIIGTGEDFTKVSMGKAIILLSIPMVLEMIMESIFSLVDIYFVSTLGEEAIAIVGITESIITIVYAISIGITVAVSAMVARRIGEKNFREAGSTAFQGILIAFVVSALVAFFGIFWSKGLLKLMNADKKIVGDFFGYTSIMLGGNVVIMLLFIINGVFRGIGDASLSMRVLWLANILNIILDPILIYGWGPIPAMGVEGAAIATNIGRGIAVIYQFHLLFSCKARICIRKEDFRIDPSIIMKIIKLSFGSIGQSIIATSSWIGLVRIVTEFGNTVVAGYTIAVRIIVFAWLPSWGIGNAAATLVGQNLGAGKPERAEKSAWVSAKANLFFLGFIGIILMLSPEFFMQLISSDSSIIKSGAKGLRIMSIGFLTYGFGMAIIQAFNGAGETKVPTTINLICFWLFEIPLAYFLSQNTGLKENGVYISIVSAESLMAMMAVVIFKRGHWKHKKV